MEGVTMPPGVEAKIEQTLSEGLDGYKAELLAVLEDHEAAQRKARESADVHKSDDSGEIKRMLNKILDAGSGPSAAADEEPDPAAASLIRRRRWKNWAAVLGLVLGGGGGGGGYYYSQHEGEAGVDVKTRTLNLETAVRGCEAGKDCTDKERKASLQGVSGLNSKKADRLKDLHMNQRELVIDVRDETMAAQKAIAEKLHVDLSTEKNEYGKVEPATVTEAREEVKAWKALESAKKAKEAQKKGDPFSDL